MDTKLVEEAIRKAIKGGAAQARPNPLLPDSDMNLARTQTDVEIEPQVLEDYLADLMRDQQMARLDSAFATVPTGGGTGTRLPAIARRLLARAIASGDVSGTVEAFRGYIEKNAAPMTAVMAVSGVKSLGEVRLGPDIRLVPMTSLSPSWPRGEALGRPVIPTSAVPRAVSSALVTTLDFGPIFYWPYEGGHPSATAHQRVRSALQHLDEARTLLSLLEINADMRLFWVQPQDPLMGTGADAGWLSSREFVYPGEDVEVDVEAAKELATAYFRLEHTRRQEMLHIPLNRLDRVVRGDDPTDRSIDLGIALEALLLHGLKDQTELKFRLSLRGAWLCGNDVTERGEIQKILGDVYKLRSTAVHTGRVKLTDENYETIRRGTTLCKRIIRKMIEVGGSLDWSTLVLGGTSGKA